MLKERPTLGDLVAEVGDRGLTVHPDGSYDFKVPAEHTARVRAMTARHRALEAQRGQVINSAFPRFLARDARTGRVRTIIAPDPAKEAQMAQAGAIRPFVRHGGAAVVSDANGYLWRVDGRKVTALHRRKVGVFEESEGAACRCVECSGVAT